MNILRKLMKVYFKWFMSFCTHRFEDGESDGIRIPDNSVRKTLRYRPNQTNSSDPVERRKSRRHSTGNSPIMPPPIPSQPKRYSPPVHQQTVDEDSSSSGNSAEPNDVFGVAMKSARDGPGVTPGLRRRRERAERQKTFIREQQEAAATGIRPFDGKDDPNLLGKYNFLLVFFHPFNYHLLPTISSKFRLLNYIPFVCAFRFSLISMLRCRASFAAHLH